MDPISTRTALGAAGAGGAAAGYDGYVALGVDSDPTLVVYEVSTASGWGTKYTKSAQTSSVRSVTFTPNGEALVTSGDSTGVKVTAYVWNNPGFGSQYAQGSNMPTGIPGRLTFNVNGTFIGYVRHGVRSEAISWNNGFSGTKYVSNYNKTNYGDWDVKFSPDGNWVATATGESSGGLKVESWSDSSGFGTPVYSQNTGAACRGCVWTPDSDYILVCIESSPWIEAYPWNNPGFGTKVSNPGSIPSGVFFWTIDISPDGDAVVLSDASGSSPRVHAWEWTGSGWGAKYSNPSSVPTSWNVEAKFSPDGSLVLIADNNDVLNLYEWSGSTGFGAKYAAPAGGGIHNLSRSYSFQPLAT